MQGDMDTTAADSAEAWCQSLLASNNMFPMIDSSGNSRLVSPADILASYGSTTDLAQPWLAETDISAAVAELETELNFNIETVPKMIGECFTAYIHALKAANEACTKLYVYTRRLDAAFSWASEMPTSMQRDDDAKGVRGNLRDYLHNLSGGEELRKTLDIYAKATIKVQRLRTLFAIIAQTADPVIDSITDTTAIVSVGTSTPVGGLITSPSFSELQGATLKGNCPRCENNPIHVACVPCGHVLCGICCPDPSPLISKCPICDVMLTNRLVLNF